MLRCLVLALLVLPCVACSRGQDNPRRSQSVSDANFDYDDATATASVAGAGAENPLHLKVDSSGKFSRKSDSFYIDELEMQGDLLKLSVSYGGCCETHRFDLWTDNVLSQGQPPVVKLFIGHDSYGDPCEAGIQRHLWVDLLPIKTAFLKAHPGRDSGLVSIELENREVSIQYTFGP